jgi:ABC-2 type transport system permease protein
VTTVVAPQAVGTAVPSPAGRASPVAGLGPAVRLVLRRDRLRIGLWVAGIVGLVVATAASITGVYSTTEDLERYARTVRGNSALIVQSGPGYGLNDPAVEPTTGAVVMNEVGVWTILAVALMAVFMLVRHTRTEEETGRAETVRALPVGRHTQLAAAFLSVMLAGSLVAVGVAASLVAYDLPVAGSVAFALALVGAAAVFGAVAAVTAQVASGARAALGLAGAVIGVAFVVRAIGDVQGSVVTWFSPIGWAQGIRAYADERWWVLLLPVVATAGLLAVAVGLQSRRDLGAGLLVDRPGPSVAAPWLSTSLALAVRLQRASVLWWTFGIGVFAFFYGIVAEEAETIIEENPEMEEFFAQLGQGSITDAFLSTAMLIVALTATAFTVSSVLRLRSEEAAGRAEEVLATRVPRRRLVLASVLVAGVGTVVVMAVAGLAMGVGIALASADRSWLGPVLGAGLVMVPAAWVLGAVAVLAYGTSLRWSMLTWGLYAYVLVVGMLGTLLELPQWARNLSPFEHVPALPSEAMSWGPVLALTGIAGALTVAGIAVFRRRDVG